MRRTYFVCSNCGRTAALAEFEVKCPYCQSLSGTYSSEPPGGLLLVDGRRKRKPDDSKQRTDD
jgi:hypothetical protein